MNNFASLYANKEKPIGEALFAALDTETTGLSPTGVRPHRIVELGAVTFRFDGTIVDRFSSLVDPERSIPWDARAVHGISNQDVKGAPKSKEALLELMKFLGGVDILWGFNSPFDLRFLVSEFQMSRYQPPHIEFYDIRRMLKRCQLPTGTLEHVASMLNITPSTFHRATADAETTALVVCAAIKKKFSPHEQIKILTSFHSKSTPVYDTAKCVKALSS
jgi:DNA polymerase III epsilon subunit family exonuclease